MIKVVSKLSVACAIAMIATSCDKEESESRSEILVHHSWVFEHAEVNDGRGGTSFYNASSVELNVPELGMQECNADNVMTFTADGKYVNTTGDNNCDGAETEEKGTWLLKDGDNILSTTSDGITAELPITEMSAERLKVSLGKVKLDLPAPYPEYGDLYIVYKAK